MPKIVFFSNYLNHHQLPFCKELVKLTNNNFYFVSQKAISEKRITLGYKNIANDYHFNVKTYESKEEKEKAYELSNEADCVLFGSSNVDYIEQRIKDGKITFKVSERLFRKKITIFNFLRSYRRVYVNHLKYKDNNLYMLCNGLYAAYDFNRFGAYLNKTYKWAYFTELIEYDINELMRKKDDGVINMLWVGRFMKTKHPEMIIHLAKRLINDKYSFNINVIGNGELENEIKDKVKSNKLEKYVHLLGSMPPELVREHMERSNIFLFTSDFGEGWGAVLNEAMNSGCACVASHAAGSTSYLIKHYENGVVFKSEDDDDLFVNVKHLMDNKELIEKCGINAYKTIRDTWNAKVAAERFIKLNECLLNGEDTPYNEGPCSKAMPIGDKDMYRYLVKE